MSTARPSVAKVPANATLAPASASALPRGCSNFKLRQADRLVSRHYDGFMASAGLKTSQYALLSHIAQLAPVRPADLAQRMALEPSTLTRNLQPLVAQAWVAVGPGTDGRSRHVSLTEAGRAKRTEAQRAWKKAQQAFNAKLGEARVAQLHALLDDCMRLLSADPDAEGDPTMRSESATGPFRATMASQGAQRGP
jgi:DNA-binding MarR family transcriptional regulator